MGTTDVIAEIFGAVTGGCASSIEMDDQELVAAAGGRAAVRATLTGSVAEDQLDRAARLFGSGTPKLPVSTRKSPPESCGVQRKLTDEEETLMCFSGTVRASMLFSPRVPSTKSG